MPRTLLQMCSQLTDTVTAGNQKLNCDGNEEYEEFEAPSRLYFLGVPQTGSLKSISARGNVTGS